MKANVAAATVVSLFLGIAIAVLFAFLDRTIKNADDAKAAALAPVLGIIPMLADEGDAEDQRARDLYVFEHPNSTIAECCRSLRTNILFSGADRPLKSLVVSSANPREGKTTTTIYIGTTMAQSGQRVLLVDSDMRRPRLHQATGVPKNNGLSNLLLREIDYDDAIKTTEIPNLFVMPCGPQPPNPAELLMSHRFEETLAELAKRFDRVILDSPPILAVTDAVVLSRHADGVILIARAGKTHREHISRAARHIYDVDVGIVGIVLNELDVSDRRYGYYYQYAGYGYGPTDAPPEAGSV
jgi:capsular exopolysaccharide synthesis family protein